MEQLPVDEVAFDLAEASASTKQTLRRTSSSAARLGSWLVVLPVRVS